MNALPQAAQTIGFTELEEAFFREGEELAQVEEPASEELDVPVDETSLGDGRDE